MNKRTEQRALVMLQVILFAVFIGALVYILLGKKQDSGEENSKKAAEAAYAEEGHGHAKTSSNGTEGNVNPEGADEIDSYANTPMAFDPNTADSATLVGVGFTPFQAANIIKYRRRGGQYHRPEDVKKVYSLTVGQWEHIQPFIRIGKEYQYLADNEDVYAQSSTRSHGNASHTNRDDSREEVSSNVSQTRNDITATGTASPFHSSNRIQKLKAGERIDIASDSITLQKIPGIGPYYAKRIAEYGEKLGGYISLDQLNDKDLDFLPTGIEAYLTIQDVNIRKLRINKLTIRQLKEHPYITYPQAKQITERIRLYGPIHSWEELLFLSEFTERDKAKLEPYISFE